MSLEAAIQENTAALHTLIALMQGGAAVQTPAAAKPAKPAASAASSQPAAKATPSAESQSEAQTSAASNKTEEPGGATSPAFSVEDVKTAALKLAQTKGRQALVDLLGKFGVAKTPELKPEQYDDFLKQAA